MDLQDMTADQLYAEAERRGVKVGKKLRKATIIEKLLIAELMVDPVLENLEDRFIVKPTFDRADRDALKRTPVTVFSPHRAIPEKVQLKTRAERRHVTMTKKTIDGQTVKASKTIPKWGRPRSQVMASASKTDLAVAKVYGEATAAARAKR